MRSWENIKDDSAEHFGSNVISRLIVFGILIVIGFKVLVPMVHNTIEIQRYYQQSSRIQSTNPVPAKVISVKTVFTDIQPVPRILPSQRIHGREVKVQVGDKLGDFRYTKASTWSRTQTIVVGEEYLVHIDPFVRGESELQGGSLYTDKVFAIFLALDLALALLLLYLIFYVISIPQRWGDLSNLQRASSITPGLILSITLYLLGQYLFILLT